MTVRKMSPSPFTPKGFGLGLGFRASCEMLMLFYWLPCVLGDLDCATKLVGLVCMGKTQPDGSRQFKLKIATSSTTN